MLASACALDMNGLGPLSDADAGSVTAADADGTVGPEDAEPVPPDGQGQAGDEGVSDVAAVSPPFDAANAAPDAPAPDAPLAAVDAAPDAASNAPDATSNVPDATSNVPDAASNVPDAASNAGPDAAADVEGEAGPPCDSDAGCIVVPEGWMLVAFATSQMAPCPAGFGQQSIDVEESPDVSNACTCGSCALQTTPSCSSGPIPFFYDSSPFPSVGCASEAASLANDLAGGCNTDVPAVLSSATHVEFDPPAPAGGSCTVPGEVVPDRVTFASEGRTCLPDDPTSAQCTGDVCTPQVADPYAPCIARTGQWDCPPGPLGAVHLVGTSLSISCGDCPCTLTGTCSGTVNFYPDPACHGAPWAVQADGTCGPSPATAAAPTFQSYDYTGGMAQDLECQYSGSQIESLTLEGAMTICCAP
jgi:hypothetical protein